MDFSAFIFEQLGKVEAYLSASRSSQRLVALGRMLQLEQVAFSLRNAELITVNEYDRFDDASARVRRLYNLHGDYRDKAAGRAYNDRFLPFEPYFDSFEDDSQPGHQPKPSL